MHLYRMWFSIIGLHIFIHTNVMSVVLDVDENLVLKICNMKFCDATKTNVSLGFHIKSNEKKNLNQRLLWAIFFFFLCSAIWSIVWNRWSVKVNLAIVHIQRVPTIRIQEWVVLMIVTGKTIGDLYSSFSFIQIDWKILKKFLCHSVCVCVCLSLLSWFFSHLKTTIAS